VNYLVAKIYKCGDIRKNTIWCFDKFSHNLSVQDILATKGFSDLLWNNLITFMILSCIFGIKFER
jgi:hypothetical protein